MIRQAQDPAGFIVFVSCFSVNQAAVAKSDGYRLSDVRGYGIMRDRRQRLSEPRKGKHPAVPGSLVRSRKKEKPYAV